jgi:hypothetical protein
MTSAGDDGTTPRWPEVVQSIIEAARRDAGSGPALAARLEALGVGGETGRYSESAISNWIKGRTMPPADAVLAAAYAASISIDETLGHLAARELADQVSDRDSVIQQLRRELDKLRAEVIDLYGRLGFERAGEVDAPPAATKRRRSAG